MERIFVIALVVLTSLLAYAASIRNPGMKARPLRFALEAVFECVGASSVFLAVNIILGVAIILVMRSLTNQFVSLYPIGDLLVVVLSVFQGFLFQLWWRE